MNYVLTMVCTNLGTVRISRCMQALLIDQCLARETWFPKILWSFQVSLLDRVWQE